MRKTLTMDDTWRKMVAGHHTITKVYLELCSGELIMAHKFWTKRTTKYPKIPKKELLSVERVKHQMVTVFCLQSLHRLYMGSILAIRGSVPVDLKKIGGTIVQSLDWISNKRPKMGPKSLTWHTLVSWTGILIGSQCQNVGHKCAYKPLPTDLLFEPTIPMIIFDLVIIKIMWGRLGQNYDC